MKPQIWDQLKNKTAFELIQALERDGAIKVGSDHGGSAQFYKLKSGLKIAIHFHPQKTYDPKMLRYLLETTGWTEQDLKLLKLIK
jgi:predicted RNA binding protein YcfA (HicA-like mRNA interferase family)